MQLRNKLSVLLFFSAMASFCFAGWIDAPVVDASADLQQEQPAKADAPETPVLDMPEETDELIEDQEPYDQLPDFPVDAKKKSTQPQLFALDTSNMSSDQRLKLLERQINNMASMNFAEQISDLQRQIAMLKGELEVQNHQVVLLNQQLKHFYEDVDARIGGVPVSRGESADLSPTKKKSVAKPPAQTELKETADYQAAFSLLGKRSYSGAKSKLLSYLHHYPQGQHAADANYWLGEIDMIDKNYQDAEKFFQAVLNNYPESAKAVDAELKLAMIHANAGQTSKAKKELRSIVKQHPDSAVAQLASIRLQQLEQ